MLQQQQQELIVDKVTVVVVYFIFKIVIVVIVATVVDIYSMSTINSFRVIVKVAADNSKLGDLLFFEWNDLENIPTTFTSSYNNESKLFI